MFHTTDELKNMSTESLQNFLVGAYQAANLRQVQDVLPETRGYNLNHKSGCLGLYRKVYKDYKDEQLRQYQNAIVDVAVAIHKARQNGNNIVPEDDDCAESAKALIKNRGDQYIGIDRMVEAIECSSVDIEPEHVRTLAVDIQLHLLMVD